MASVQVETAWGRLDNSQVYVGVEAYFADFPFIQQLGLSSYPYFGWAQPEDLPIDYYQRLLAGRPLPAMVVEGGWASASAGTFSASPDKQARYVTRHAALLDQIGAKGWMQLQFADFDTSAFPPPLPDNLVLFSSIGLADSRFAPKPALAAWDALFARRLV